MPALTDAQIARTAAAAGADVLRRRFGDAGERTSKGGTDFATEADYESERTIRAVIEAQRPDDTFFGEESDGDILAAGTSGRFWLVDPLCGTANYAASTPLAAVNVALRADGDVRVAAVAEPLLGTIVWTDGDGAYGGDGLPLQPSSRSRMIDVNLDYYAALSGEPWPLRLLADEEVAARFARRVVSSTLALTWVASGQRAAYLTDGPGLADSVHFAAGIALCRAAGCVVTGLRGQPLGDAPEGLLAAADAETHDALVAAVGRATDD